VEEIAQEPDAPVDDGVAVREPLDDVVVTDKPDRGVWSVKEILGHLVDLAANNHQRFVRAQQAHGPAFLPYGQDAWVSVQEYQAQPRSDLLSFWHL